MFFSLNILIIAFYGKTKRAQKRLATPTRVSIRVASIQNLPPNQLHIKAFFDLAVFGDEIFES